MNSNEELALRSDESLFLGQALQDLESDQPSPEEMLALLGRVFAARTVAVFAPEFCVFAWGDAVEQALQCAITGVEEPSVQQAWASQAVVVRESDEISPLFGPTQGLAVPLPGSDLVLYLGEAKRFDAAKAKVLARHLLLYLRLFEEKRDRMIDLEESRSLAARLSAGQEGTCRALAALSGMEGSLEFSELLQRFGREVGESIRFDAGFLVLDGKIHSLISAHQPDQEQESALLRLARASRVPVMVESLGTAYVQLRSFGSSSVIAPLRDRGGLVLFRDHRFDPHHRAAAEICVGYLALSLRFSEMHGRIQRSQAEMARAGKLASVGQMAAGLAHEINNPLGSIVLALDTVKRFVETKPQVALSVLDEALSAAERAQEIVRKMLHFSRDSRQGFRKVKSIEWLRDLRTVVTPRLSQEGTELCVLDPADDFELFANPGELTQVAVNLVFNAHDAAPRGRIEVALSTDSSDWVLTVKDDGPGVPEDLRDRIFEPFFTTKDVGDGTGLGLHISRQIVEAHGGRLSLLPTDSGALFEVRVPLE